VTVRSDVVPDALAVSGLVAWSAGGRGGIAFAGRQPGSRADPERWFKKLVEALPQLADDARRSPDRLPLDAALFVRAAPSALPGLSADEVALLQRADNGVRAQALITRSHLPADRAARALFGLLAKGVLSLAFGEAGEPWRWRALLARAGIRPPPPPAAAAPPPPPPPPRAARRLPAIVRLPPSAAAATPVPSAPPRLARATPLAGAELPRPARPPAAHGRPATAQLLVDEARAAAETGHIHDQAIPLLRRALALAPRDPEIAQLLGTLAFKDRKLV
jgi:hypothetical protein